MALLRRALFWPSKNYISSTNTNYKYIIFASTGDWTPVSSRRVDRKQMLYPLDHDAPILNFTLLWSYILKGYMLYWKRQNRFLVILCHSFIVCSHLKNKKYSFQFSSVQKVLMVNPHIKKIYNGQTFQSQSYNALRA